MQVPGAVTLLLTLSAALPLAGQEPAERARLDSLRDAFNAYADSTALAARERERIAVARTNRDDPFIHMELGWLAQRLGDLTGTRRHYDDAAGEFQWATELRPGWAYAWYWLGVAELANGESNVIVMENIRQVLGIDFLSQAVRAFARAIEVDPAFTEALVELATTALRQRVNARVEMALEALRAAAATPAGRVPMVWLMRGRLERRSGAGDSALIAFRQYLATGGDRGVGNVEVARALAVLGRRDTAIVAYRTALEPPLSDAARLEIRRDLRWIADPDELAAFDTVPPDSVGAFVSRFWSGRDVEDGRRAGERLVEQFRRYAHAVANFQLVSRRRGYGVSLGYRDTTQSELDDRGVIYLRHGEPDYRVVGPGASPQTWVYLREGPQGNLLFHFEAVGDVQDFRLLQSVAGRCAQASDYCADLGRYDDVYARLQGAGTESRPNLAASERIHVMQTIRTGTTSDSYRMTFRGELRPVISTFVVAGPERRPELHVVFAVPAGRLHAVDAPSGVLYPLLLRVVVFDSLNRAVATVDTVRTFRAGAALAVGSFLTEQLVVAVPAGSWRLHVVVEEVQSGYGAMVRAHPVDAPAFDRGFSMSDLIVGREGSGLTWRRAVGDVPLNPLARFPVGGAATLYYEIYGLPQGASVETRVSIRGAGGRSLLRRVLGGGGRANLSYTTVTDAPGLARVRQRLELGGLSAGRYTLELEMTDPVSGRRVNRRDSFEIAGRAP